jgi:MFS family permease
VGVNLPGDKGGLRAHRDFQRLWAAQTVSVFGSLVSRAALSFTAILTLKATPFQLGLLMVANLLPRFLAGPAAGVWVDRARRRPLMVAADLGRALLLGSIPAAAAAGALHIEQLYAVALLVGLLTLLFDVANRSFLPVLVGREHLVAANSRLTASASVAEVGAFALAGWLVQWLSGPTAVLIDALSFLVSALFIGMIRAREPELEPAAERPGAMAEFVEGLQVVRRSAVLGSLAVSTLLLGLSGGAVGAVMVAFMTRTLGFPPGVLGMIWAVGGVTSLLGALAAGAVIRRLGVGPTLSVGLALSGLGTLLVPLARGVTLLSGGLLVANQLITDPAHTLYDIAEVSLRQAVTPDRLLGRVNATLEATGLGASLLGALAGGLLAQHIGLRAALAIAASGTLLAALWLWVSPIRRAGRET